MKCSYFLITFVALTTALSFAQDFGARVAGGTGSFTGDAGEDLDDYGWHVGGGAFMLCDFGFAALNVGASAVYKTPGGTDNLKGPEMEIYITEIAIEIPVLLRYFVTKRIYIEAGPQINLAFSPTSKMKSNIGQSLPRDEDIINDRFFEFGIAGTFGYMINKKLSMDMRYFRSLTNYVDAEPKGGIHQLSFGISYLFWRS